MSAPAKPWEQARILQSTLNLGQNLQVSGAPRLKIGGPVLPPRPNMMRPSTYVDSSYHRLGGMSYSPYDSYGSYGGYGNSYGSYQRYGGGGMLGGSMLGGGMLGGYGMYENNGYGAGPESRFIQLAEESTRSAFQGIESLVRTFDSIAMMFGSTFFAVQSSFRAVLGVAENFGRIRTMFGQLWSNFALLRFMIWCYKKLMNMFGVTVAENIGKAAWNEAVKETGNGGTQNTSSWPIFVFLGMIVSAPYLISKLRPPLVDKRDPKNWGGPAKAARAIHPFQASSMQELTLAPGDKIIIAPMSIQHEMNLNDSGWVYASSQRGTGIVPLNYIQLATNKQNAAPSAPNVDNLEQQKINENITMLKEQYDRIDKSSQLEN